MGRRSKYTPDVIERIEHALGLGATRRLACQYAGIDQSTFEDWYKRKPDFSDIVQSAEGSASVGWLQVIEKSARDGQWTAAAWKLERRYPAEYGRRITEHQGAGGGPIEVRSIVVEQPNMLLLDEAHDDDD